MPKALNKRKSLSLFLIKMVLFLLPFTAFFTLLPSLNPYAQQLAFYPLVLLMFLLFINLILVNSVSTATRKIFRPFFYLLFLALLSFLLNLDDILAAHLQGRSGTSQFLTNLAQLFLGIIFIMIFVFVLKKNGIENFEKSVVKSINVILSLLCIYCIFELLSYYKIGTEAFTVVAGLFHYDKLIGDDIIGSAFNYGRIKGFSQEPSHLGIIFSIYFPFFIYHNKGSKLYKVFLFIVLMFFTFSKTLFLIFIIEIIFYFFLTRSKFFSNKAFYRIVFFLLCTSFLALSPIVSSFFVDVSAISRASSQIAAVSGWVGSKKFLFGEGIGQHGFYTMKYYEEIGSINLEFVSVIDGKRWPFIQNIHLKILVEMGIVGFIAWLYIFIFLITRVNRILKNKFKHDGIIDIYGQATIISIFGIFLAGFSYENFSFLFTWIAFGIAVCYLVGNKKYLYMRG